MPKPKANKAAKAASSAHKHHTRKKMRPAYCRYCTAKLPWNRKFCNKEHESLFIKTEKP